MPSQSARVAARALFPMATARLVPARALQASRPLLQHVPRATRPAHFKAFDANMDEAELAEARKWHGSFDWGALPPGTTTFARSSGPGGQHVNKTESKATTSWTVGELSAALPRVLRRRLRSSRYYTARNDALTFSAQTERHRSANVDENREKLERELRRIYAETVPGEADPKKAKRHAEIEETFHNQRIKGKKFLSAKKKSRRSSFGE